MFFVRRLNSVMVMLGDYLKVESVGSLAVSFQ
jgi:hypothetical protein